MPSGVFSSPRAGRSSSSASSGVGVPEEIRQARSFGVGLPLRIGRLFQPEHEAGRLQHRFDHGLRAGEERLFALEDRLVAGDLLGLERAAESASAESLDEFGAADRIVLGGRLARDQAARIAAPERAGGQTLRGPAIGVGQNRRDRERLVLVLEAVDVVFGGKLGGRVAGVLQQVADGVVVLAVRQAPQHDLRGDAVSACLDRPVAQRFGQFRAGKLRQVRDPRPQRCLFGAALRDPFAAGVRDAQGRLQEEERISRDFAGPPVPPVTCRTPRRAPGRRFRPGNGGVSQTRRPPHCGNCGSPPFRGPGTGR